MLFCKEIYENIQKYLFLSSFWAVFSSTFETKSNNEFREIPLRHWRPFPYAYDLFLHLFIPDYRIAMILLIGGF